MPKKKLSNRLNKLFDEINEEAQTQAKSPVPSSKKPSKKAETTISIPVASETPDPFSRIGNSMRVKDTPLYSDGSTPVSTMLSTAFRTDDKSWATLKIMDESGQRTWGGEEQMLVKQVADQLSLALENARLFQETQLRAEELAVLNELARALTAQLDVEQVLQETYRGVSRLIDTKNFFIGLYNSERYEIVYPLNITESTVDKEITAVPADQGMSGYLLRTREPLLIKSNMREWLDAHNVQIVGDIAASWLGVPLMTGDELLGVMAIQEYHKSEAYNEHTLELLTAFASQAAIAIQNARLFEESLKFRLGLERSADAVFMTNIEGAIIYANPGFERVYGYSQDEVLGKNPRIIKSGLIPQEQYKLFWETLLNKETVSGELVNRRKDGKLVPVAGTNSPILDKNGNILGFLAIHSDITKRKEDEEALQRRNEYLAASAEIGRLVTSTLDLEAIFSRSVNLIVERFGFYYASIFIIEETGFNAVLREATGKAGQKLKERKHALTIGSNSTVGKATDSGEVVVINNTAIESFHRHNPLLPKTKAEAAIPLKIGNRIIGALDIQSTEINAFSEDDIAILQLLADQIAVGIDNARSYNIAQQAVEEMREVDRLKSQFLANMSHELRTPLNSIIGFARVILKGIDGPTTDLQQQDLTAIFNSGQHLLGLINDILDLSRIEAGKMDLTFDEVNMAELISSVMSTATGLIKDKPIALKREIPNYLPLVRADAMRVRQVLINFLSNAAKFTEEGEIIVKAQVEESTKGQPMVLVSVTDTGPGIALEDQSKLFQPFSQVDASLTRKVGGTGLGLSICQHLIQMHGGQIGIQSNVGQGSTFYFLVPVSQSESKTEGIYTNRVILAIDDEPQIISLYERYLEPKGFQVIGLSDPTKAKERVEQLKPFAITLDIMMPGYDGWQVLTDLKSSSETRDVPVIICSIVDEEDKGFSLGAADYLIKPIHEEDLLNALDRLNGDGSIREVLVIDDDPNDLRLLGKMITEQGNYQAVLAEGGPAGWSIISSKAPHAIVLDLFMPEMDGFTILEQMRQDKKLRDIPVVVITGADLTADQQKQLDDLGKRLLQKSSLKEHELIETVENVLQRVRVK